MPYGRVVWEPYPARDEIQIVLPDYLITEESMNGFAVTKVQQYHSDLSSLSHQISLILHISEYFPAFHRCLSISFRYCQL
ncbi:MAG: hypothetical protein K8S16_11975 [Bacteroidales bacterium]|nr:hypothetical protein [Bacteroidales bacterium]